MFTVCVTSASKELCCYNNHSGLLWADQGGLNVSGLAWEQSPMDAAEGLQRGRQQNRQRLPFDALLLWPTLGTIIHLSNVLVIAFNSSQYWRYGVCTLASM